MAMPMITDEVLAEAREKWADRIPTPERNIVKTMPIMVRSAGQEEAKQGTRGLMDATGGVGYQRPGGAFYAVWGKDDAQGHTFHAAVTALIENNNVTWAEVRYTPKHTPMPQDPTWVVYPVYKIDDMSVYPVKRDDNPNRADLVFFFGTHSVGLPERYIALEFAVIENVYAYSATAELESEGGQGGYRGPDEGLPPPPVPSVTKDELQAWVREVLGVEGNGTLLGNFGAGGNVRIALEQKMLDGMRDANNAGLPPDNNGIAQRAAEYRHFQRLQFAENMLWLLDPNNGYPAAGGARYLLRYRTVEDGAYTADMNAIRDSGLAKPAAQTRAAQIDLSANEEAGAKAAADAALEELRQRWEAEAEAARKAMEQEQEQTPEEGGE